MSHPLTSGKQFDALVQSDFQGPRLCHPSVRAGFSHGFGGAISGRRRPLLSLRPPICHQMPERSFELLGFPWAVCHRCSGIYLGVLLAAVFYTAIPRRLTSHEMRRYWVAAATAPLLMDVGLTAAGVWNNAPLSRLCTGFLFGSMLSSLLVPAFSEFLQPWNLSRCRTTEIQGGAW